MTALKVPRPIVAANALRDHLTGLAGRHPEAEECRRHWTQLRTSVPPSLTRSALTTTASILV